MITRDILLSNGYKEFKPSSFTPYAHTAYQKRVRDVDPYYTKYFITVYEYRFDDIPNYPNPDRVGYQFEVQLTLPNKDVLRLTYSSDVDTALNYIEQLYESCYTNLGCTYSDYD